MKKNIFYLFGLTVVLLVLIFSIPLSWSDSGWDTDYSSSSSSYDSSSSSSSYHSSNSRSYSNGTYEKPTTLKIVTIMIANAYLTITSICFFLAGDFYKKSRIFKVIFLIISWGCLIGMSPVPSLIFSTCLSIMAIAYAKEKRKNSKYEETQTKKEESQTEKEISEEELQAVLPDYSLETLKKELYQRFVTIQNAWMNFDYDTLKRECSDELFHTYEQQLKALKLKNQQNIMSDFKLEGAKITKISKKAQHITVSIEMAVSFRDYVMSGNRVVMGDNISKIINLYQMDFIVSNVSGDIKCPSCGAKLENYEDKVCPYCRNKIVIPSKHFVLTKKVNERTIH